MSDHFFISVDWGTTNIRVRLVSYPSLKIQKEISSPEGVKDIYNQWQISGGNREDFFLKFLKSKTDQFNSKYKPALVVISGMASASIGLRELPYSTLPFDTNGSSLHIEQISNTNIPYPIRLVSGVKSDSDVIRGEEVQVVGLATGQEISDGTVFILPGTHSKHIVCENNQIKSFNTFMTGEVFQVMAGYTILKDSIDQTAAAVNELTAFDLGVKRSEEGLSVLSEMFSIRAAQLIGTRSKTENFYFLSGLLIGEELATLKKRQAKNIKLCAGGQLSGLYQRAINVLGLSENTEVIPKEVVDESVIAGQWQLVKHELAAQSAIK